MLWREREETMYQGKPEAEGMLWRGFQECSEMGEGMVDVLEGETEMVRVDVRKVLDSEEKWVCSGEVCKRDFRRSMQKVG